MSTSTAPPSIAFPGNSLPPCPLQPRDKDELQAYFANTWELYEWLFSSIKEESSYYHNPDPRRHPLIFYYGHTAAFYVNKLLLAQLIPEGIRPDFEELFAKGVDPAKAEELGSHAWPSLEEVRQYRAKVFDLVSEVIAGLDLSTPAGWDSPGWALYMALEHDRIHWETSSVLIRQYPLSMVQAPAGWQCAPTESQIAPDQSWAEVEGGLATIGKPAPDRFYGWDNEYGEPLMLPVQDFRVRRQMVTNGEFLEFVNQGGYANPAWWSEEGWSWKTRNKKEFPPFWIPHESGFRLRTMFQELALPSSWPAEVTAHEAAAYCKWSGQGHRLMTEAEWTLLVSRMPQPDSAYVPDHAFNLNLRFGSPHPVGSLPDSKDALGISDLMGNVWDWLSNDFYPLKGFRAHPWYLDFSEPYFDAEHGMMLGGSWASSGTAASKWYRLWFRRDFVQHAGFRIAQSLT